MGTKIKISLMLLAGLVVFSILFYIVCLIGDEVRDNLPGRNRYPCFLKHKKDNPVNTTGLPIVD